MLQLTTFQSLIRLSAVTEMKHDGSGDENLQSVAILGDTLSEWAKTLHKKSVELLAVLLRPGACFCFVSSSSFGSHSLIVQVFTMEERAQLRTDFEKLQREYKNMETMRKVRACAQFAAPERVLMDLLTGVCRRKLRSDPETA